MKVIIKCPKCGRRIEGAGLNAERDLAVCGSCGEAFSISTLLSGPSGGKTSELVTPRGCWFRPTPAGWQVGATTRSWHAAFLVPFLLLWGGGMLMGLGSDAAKHKMNRPEEWHSAALFLFFVFAIVVAILMSVAGKVTVTKDGDAVTIFTGLGGVIGLRKTIPWSSINAVREESSASHSFGNRGARICLDGPRRVAFGSGLSTERRYYMMRILQQQLVSS